MHISVASCPEAKNLEAGEDWSRLHNNNSSESIACQIF